MKESEYYALNRRTLTSSVLALVASLSLASAQSSFELVNDFESGADDFTWVQDGWGVGAAEVVTDPFPGDDASNSVLAINGGNVNTNNLRGYLPIPAIAEGASGTVFVRFAIHSSDSPVNGTISLSPLEAPDTWNNNNVLMIFGSSGDISYRDGAGATDVVADAERVDQTWYKAWFQVDNQANTSSLYLQGGPFAEPTLLAENYAFREDAPVQDADDIIRIFLMVNSGSTTNQNGVLYVDDIYVDAENLTTDDPLLVQLNPSYGMLPARGAITLDGVRDGSYLSGAVSVTDFTGTIDDENDLSVGFTAAYSDAGVYMFFDITDNQFASNSPTRQWHDDSIELYFDPNNNRNGNFDGVDDVKLFLVPAADGSVSITPQAFPGVPAGADFSTLDAAVTISETGWTAEVFVPWVGLQLEPWGDWTMGFTFVVNDDDNTQPEEGDPIVDTDREALMYFGTDGLFNFGTNLFGELTILTPKEIPVGKLPAGAAITIDGVRDDPYATNSLQHVANRWLDNAPPADETEIAWYLTLDEENLYVFFDIIDGALSSDSGDAASWQDDGLEFYIDGNNSKGGAADGVDDFKWTIRLREDNTLQIVDATGQFPANPAGADFSNVEWAHTVTETGWALEGKIPLDLVNIDTTPGASFGVDLLYNDDDDGGERDAVLGWSGATGLNNRTDLFGTATIWQAKSGFVAMTEESITIDGEIDSAYESTGWHDLDRTGSGARLPTASNLSASWAALVDGDSYYLFVDVIDDALSLDSPTQSWNDDSLEIFFDASNNGAGTFDGAEDIKLVLYPQLDDADAVIAPLFTIGGFPAPPAGKSLDGAEAAWVRTELGWRAEMRIPLETISVPPGVVSTIGFELVVNDDDDGDSRDTSLSWSTIGVPNFGTHQYGDVAIGAVPFTWIVGATSAGSHNYNSWLGAFWMDPLDDGWVYHEGFHWVYAGSATDAEAGFWLYSATLENWVFIAPAVWANFYIDGTGWGYYAYVGDGVAYIYDYSQGEWFAIQ